VVFCVVPEHSSIPSTPPQDPGVRSPLGAAPDTVVFESTLMIHSLVLFFTLR
jgi:hypothetical protein